MPTCLLLTPEVGGTGVNRYHAPTFVRHAHEMSRDAKILPDGNAARKLTRETTFPFKSTTYSPATTERTLIGDVPSDTGSETSTDRRRRPPDRDCDARGRCP